MLQHFCDTICLIQSELTLHLAGAWTFPPPSISESSFASGGEGDPWKIHGSTLRQYNWHKWKWVLPFRRPTNWSVEFNVCPPDWSKPLTTDYGTFIETLIALPNGSCRRLVHVGFTCTKIEWRCSNACTQIKYNFKNKFEIYKIDQSKCLTEQSVMAKAEGWFLLLLAAELLNLSAKLI